VNHDSTHSECVPLEQPIGHICFFHKTNITNGGKPDNVKQSLNKNEGTKKHAPYDEFDNRDDTFFSFNFAG